MDHNPLAQMITTELEDSLVGYSLTQASVDRLIDVIELVKPTHFHSAGNREIWEIITQLILEGKTPDYTQVSTRYSRPQELAEKLAKGTIFSIEGAKQAADTIRDNSIKRELFSLMHNAQEALKKPISAQEFITKLEAKLLQKSVASVEVESVTQIARKFDETVQLYNAHGRLGYATGIGFDHLIGGLLPGNIWLVGAYTGTGKTFFGVQLSLNVLNQKGKVAFFSTEMDKVRIYTRMLGNVAKVSANRLIAGYIDQNIVKAQETLHSYSKSLFIFDDCYTFEQVYLQCKKLKLIHGLDVIVIDFIQNMRGSGSLYERMSQLAIDLQEMAKKLKITVVLLSQISNESQKGQQDQVISYKGAGELAAAADVGLWISKIPSGRDQNDVITYMENRIRCEIKKCRDGVSARYIDLSIDYKNGGRICQFSEDMPADEITNLFKEDT